MEQRIVFRSSAAHQPSSRRRMTCPPHRSVEMKRWGIPVSEISSTSCWQQAATQVKQEIIGVVSIECVTRCTAPASANIRCQTDQSWSGHNPGAPLTSARDDESVSFQDLRHITRTKMHVPLIEEMISVEDPVLSRYFIVCLDLIPVRITEVDA